MIALTAGAGQQASDTFPISSVAAVATDIAIGKVTLKQIRITGLLVCKMSIKLSLVFRKIFQHIKFILFWPPFVNLRPV